MIFFICLVIGPRWKINSKIDRSLKLIKRIHGSIYQSLVQFLIFFTIIFIAFDLPSDEQSFLDLD
jgi:hypothetical protein